MFKQELRVIGMRRCGQHGVINWLMAQKPLKDNTVFLNNQPFGNNPVGLKGADTLIQNYEDLDLSTLSKHRMTSPNSKKVVYILVVRDAPNLFASRVAWTAGAELGYQLTAENRDALVALWNQHAAEFLGDTDILPNKVIVNFADWFSNPKYRQALAKELGLKFSDAGLNAVPKHGGGSSFNGRAFNGKAQHMKVLDRHKEMAWNPVFKSVFEDAKLARLSLRLADFKPRRKHQRMKLKEILTHPLFKGSMAIPARIEQNIRGRIAGPLRPPIIYTIKVMMAERCKTYLEIGVLHAGCICCVMQNKYPCMFVGVDPFDGFYGKKYDPNSKCEVTKALATSNIKRNNVHGHKFDLITGLSTDPKIIKRVARKYPVVELMYIDGNHAEEVVKSDFENYGPLVPSGGIIVFDNYGDKDWPGAKLAMDKQDMTGWHTVGVWKNGLIIEKK